MCPSSSHTGLLWPAVREGQNVFPAPVMSQITLIKNLTYAKMPYCGVTYPEPCHHWIWEYAWGRKGKGQWCNVTPWCHEPHHCCTALSFASSLGNAKQSSPAVLAGSHWTQPLWDQPDGPWLHTPLDYRARLTGTFIYLKWNKNWSHENGFSVVTPKGLARGGALYTQRLLPSRTVMLLF